MKQAIINALGGLDKSYLIKQYAIGLIVCIVYGAIASKYGRGLGLYTLLTFTINTLLYPYSRYLFESLIKLFFGDTRFDKNSGALKILTLLSIIFCWSTALLLAPLSLLYIHFTGHKVDDKKNQLQK